MKRHPSNTACARLWLSRTFALCVAAAMLGLAGTARSAQSAAREGSGNAAGASTRVNGRDVPYQELEHHVGEQIEIHTTYGTVRRGTLTQYTNVELTVKLNNHGAIELSVPRDTVQRATLIGDVAPTAKEAGSAQKN
ncbi:MAG: hypothetical protein WCE70_08975 [Rhodanobacteraceae bacterium]